MGRGLFRSTKAFWVVIPLAAACVAAFVLSTFSAPAQNVGAGESKISWSLPAVSALVSAGGTVVIPVTFVSTRKVKDVSLTVDAALMAFVSVQPATFGEISKEGIQQVVLTFSVPTSSPAGIYQGSVHVFSHGHVIGDDLGITLTTATNDLSMQIPQSFQVNTQILAVGGPLSLNNFNDNYVHGGFVPTGGADIDVVSVPAPQVPLTDFVQTELRGVALTSSNSVTVAGNQGIEVSYVENYTPAIGYQHLIVYVPTRSRLHKLYLTYGAGDPLEQGFLSSFQQVLSTIQFAQ